MTKLVSYPASSSSGHKKYKNQGFRICIIVQETPQVLFTLAAIQGEADFHLLSLDKFFIGPVSLRRLQITAGELSFDQTAVVISQ